MTFRTRRRWPAVAEQRRSVIESRTANGEACTVVVVRQPDGPLLVSFHGAWKTTMAPDPQEAGELIEALRNGSRCPVMVNISWRRSSKDDRVHAFPLGQITEPGRRYLEALCSHCARPGMLEPAGHRGHWSALLDVSTCLGCLVLVSDRLADAGRYSTRLP